MVLQLSLQSSTTKLRQHIGVRACVRACVCVKLYIYIYIYIGTDQYAVNVHFKKHVKT